MNLVNSRFLMVTLTPSDSLHNLMHPNSVLAALVTTVRPFVISSDTSDTIIIFPKTSTSVRPPFLFLDYEIHLCVIISPLLIILQLLYAQLQHAFPPFNGHRSPLNTLYYFNWLIIGNQWDRTKQT